MVTEGITDARGGPFDLLAGLGSVRSEDTEIGEGEEEGEYEESSAGSKECYLTPRGQTNNSGCHSSKNYEGCSTYHADCGGGGSLELYTQLAAAVKGNNTAVIRSLLGRTDRAVQLNVRRRSVQMVNCEGAITANIPLPRGLIERLAADL